MAPNYIIDPRRFYAEGAVINWLRVVRLLEVNVNPEELRPTIQLRWMLRGNLGMPTEPFQVWARPRNREGVQKQLPFQAQPLNFLNSVLITWPGQGSMAHISVDLNAGAGGSLVAFAGAPTLSTLNNVTAFPAGVSTIEIGAPVIDGLIVPAGASVTGLRGVPAALLSTAAGWTLVETVGLPVFWPEWDGIERHGMPQGIVGAEVMAPDAAVERLTRGAPPVGWGPMIAPGMPAPPWSPPDYGALVKEVNQELLDYLRDLVATLPPNELGGKRIIMPVPPPQNSAGEVMTATHSNALVSPFAMTLTAASTDPFLSLCLGFGTAYPTNPDFGAVAFPRFDFMITAHWERGLDGQSAPVDYAAIVPAPGAALPPPVPANLAAEPQGYLKPRDRDWPWRGTARVSWDKVPNSPLFRTASFAAARAGLNPPQPVEALMDERMAGGYRPIAINLTDPAKDPAWWRNHMLDREVPIPSPPGFQAAKYGIAVQDIYGQWSQWRDVDATLQQPALDRVRIVTARLTASPPPGGGTLCAATLEVEFLWDWSVRSPERIQFAGLLYPAGDHGSPPPNLAIPPGLPRTVGGGDPLFTVTFGGGAVPSAAGASFIGLDGGGETNVGFGPSQGSEGRRYRMTVPGFTLDYALAGHIGLALWARGQEHIAPQRTGPWSTEPVVVTASDPRPPVVPVEYVQLGSLRDAGGQSHARIAWAAQPNATGYFVYESDETQILKALNRPEPALDQTLTQRLKVIKDNFGAIPRRAFTRLNATPIAGTNTDIAMPRGSTAIHCYIVIGISAGQVESEWPTDEDRLIAVAAPQIAAPAPPMLEVERFLDGGVVPPAYKVRVRVNTRPGPRPKAVELHRVRVDDAAAEVDTMGPPVARVRTSGGGWTVTNATDANATAFIHSVEGIDAPPGSWRRVWYRATAWTDLDPDRGRLPGRSAASTAAWVVVPPADSPSLSAITAGGGPDPADVVLQWTSPAPLKRTPLGPHTLTVRVGVAGGVAGAAPGTPPLISLDAPLDKLPTAMPAAPDSGVWVVGTAGGVTTYRAIVRRADIGDPLRVAVRITDPLGRVGEALKEVAGGAVNPAPDITDVAVRVVTVPLPRRTLLSFASTVPLVAPPDGPYRVRVTAFPVGPAFPRPIPTVIEMAVGDVPLVPPSRFATGLFRIAGSGPKITYTLRTTARISRFVIRITAPDGRFAEVTQVV